ncbi:MAG: hypothetical protein Q8Q91_03460 [Candidatus Daviesbacteria bacterium]|nr:hypothetical protein [Candidatus Daviesbacteria bacterium]
MELKHPLDIFAVALVGLLTILGIYWLIPFNLEITLLYFLSFYTGTNIWHIFSKTYRQKNPIIWWAISIPQFIGLLMLTLLLQNLISWMLFPVGITLGYLGRNGSRESFEAELNKPRKKRPVIIRWITMSIGILFFLVLALYVVIINILEYPTRFVARTILKRRIYTGIYEAGVQMFGLHKN